jgi:hypothetical protein
MRVWICRVGDDFPFHFKDSESREIIGKLGRKEIREQRSENEGVRGGGRIYFGRRDLTARAGVNPAGDLRGA